MMRFDPAQPDLLCGVQWFFVPEPVMVLENYTAFSSLNWYPQQARLVDDGSIGEVGGRARSWVNGAPPSNISMAGHGMCGTMDEFAGGLPVDGPLSPIPYELPTCCVSCCPNAVPGGLVVTLTNGFSCSPPGDQSFSIVYSPTTPKPTGGFGAWTGPFMSGLLACRFILWCEDPLAGPSGWSYGMQCGSGPWLYVHFIVVGCSPFSLENAGFAVWSDCCTGSLSVAITE